MNPVTHFKKILILPIRTLLRLGAIFALAITAHAQNLNLYASAQVPPSHAILEFTPDGTQSIYASGLLFPRGLAFDGIGNLFAAEIVVPDDHDIGRVLKFNLRNHVSTFGSAAWFTFEGLATDIAGNAYVMATDDRSPTAPAQSSNSHLMESGSSSVPFLAQPATMSHNQAGAWLSTARVISMQQTVAPKRSINSLRMDLAPFSSDQAPSIPASIPSGWLSIATVICSSLLTPCQIFQGMTRFLNSIPRGWRSALSLRA